MYVTLGTKIPSWLSPWSETFLVAVLSETPRLLQVHYTFTHPRSFCLFVDNYPFTTPTVKFISLILRFLLIFIYEFLYDLADKVYRYHGLYSNLLYVS